MADLFNLNNASIGTTNSTDLPVANDVKAVDIHTLQLSEAQARAMQTLDRFLADPNQRMFVLKGFAGTGKTTVIQHKMRELLAQRKRIAFTALSNQAVNVAKRAALEAGLAIGSIPFKTIHSLMGLRMANRDGEKVLEQLGSSSLLMFDVVFVDECSMANKALFAIIESIMRGLPSMQPLKMVFMGDPAQLDPVGESRSPTFTIPNRALLDEVIRQKQGNPLMEVITDARQQVMSKARPHVPFEFYSHASRSKRSGALMITELSLLNYALKRFADKFADDPYCFRILCWRNERVDYYNTVIRRSLYGNAPRFQAGDRLISRESALAPDGKTVLLQTSIEVVVQSAAIEEYKGYRAWSLVVKPDNDLPCRIYVLHENDQDRFEMEKQRLLDSAKRNKGYAWRLYYQHLEQFANVRPCWALTIHNSQGSTFLEGAIDVNDMRRRLDGKNSGTREYNKLCYVALSRFKKRAFLIR